VPEKEEHTVRPDSLGCKKSTSGWRGGGRGRGHSPSLGTINQEARGGDAATLKKPVILSTLHLLEYEKREVRPQKLNSEKKGGATKEWSNNSREIRGEREV